MHVPSPERNTVQDKSDNPVYMSIKSMIIQHELEPGHRIMPEPLADQLFVSSTPVREALIRLSAEGLFYEISSRPCSVRQNETIILPKAGVQTKNLCLTYHKRNSSDLIAALAEYHHHRIERTDKILHGLTETDVGINQACGGWAYQKSNGI